MKGRLMLLALASALVLAPIAAADVIRGTDGPDNLNGTAAADLIYGRGGNDIIRAHDGNEPVALRGLGRVRRAVDVGGPEHRRPGAGGIAACAGRARQYPLVGHR